jgi:hypothetical protein
MMNQKLRLGLQVWASARVRALTDKILESDQSSEGVFYVVPHPKSGWRVFPYRYDEFPGESDHPEVWEDIVAPVISMWWSGQNPKRADKIEDAIKLHTYGFPRGRVQRIGIRYMVSHGNDWKGLVSKNMIERAFGISGKATWEFDSHEQVQEDDKKTVQQVFKLKKDWPSVSSDYGF